jgi:hypothetical protein
VARSSQPQPQGKVLRLVVREREWTSLTVDAKE